MAADSSDAQSEAFDVEAAVAEFVADAEKTSLELPHMTTGQRKNAKRVVEKYAELVCESYGFGPERQLHVFKKDARDKDMPDMSPEALAKASGAVSVKNTFIDGWADDKGDAGAESVVFRSMPPQLRKSSLTTCMEESPAGGGADSEGRVAEASEREEGSPLPNGHLGDTPGSTQPLQPILCSDRSTAASSTGTMDRVPLGLPLPPGLEVRNTFIHFDGAPTDDRVVQSMPRDMFRQSLYAELLGDRAAAAAAASTSAAALGQQLGLGGALPTTPLSAPSETPTATAAMPPEPALPVKESPPVLSLAEQTFFASGTEVITHGLVKAPAFNGLAGIIQSYDEATSRYVVHLSLATGGTRMAQLKGENLRIVTPSPPCYYPTVPHDVHWGSVGVAPCAPR
eukprot:TRINITY_DN15978_c0_g1_i1.p1 TRINITY_DN15978_c0_g1~~TRINITY_DN15978_c0_g1_i1.p1  ORF type:complete len:398 (-),score=70.78 TRINITY_DN15978_c0_g1_i1:152-1345(-)